MKTLRWFWLVALLLASAPAGAYDDLLQNNRSDSAIKPFVFPKSLEIVQSRPERGLYFFHAGDQPRFDEGFPTGEQAEPGEFDRLLSEPKLLRKTLGKVDPARVAPVRVGKDLMGPVTREALQQRAKQTDADFLLVFRRAIFLEGTVPATAFVHAEELLQHAGKVRIKYSAALYLTKQNKTLALDAVEREFEISGDSRTQWTEQTRQALKQLARQAGAVVQANKYEKRRSNY